MPNMQTIFGRHYGSVKDSLNALMKVFVDFSKLLGLKINFEKTKILRIGPAKYKDDMLMSPWPLKWEDRIKVLGVEFTAD